MENLIKAQLILDKVIKPETEIWVVEDNSLEPYIKFNLVKAQKCAVIAYLLLAYNYSPDTNSVLVFRSVDLVEWMEDNKDKWEIKGQQVKIPYHHVGLWDFVKKRNVNFNPEPWENEGMEGIVSNDYQLRSVEYEKGKFKDLLYSPSKNKYYDYIYKGNKRSRGGYLAAEENCGVVEVDVSDFYMFKQ